MQTHKGHCSTLGRTVDLAIVDQSAEESGASAPISAIVCLDRGPQCTGATCPITGAAPAVMTLRLARSGLGSASDEVLTPRESEGRSSAKERDDGGPDLARATK